MHECLDPPFAKPPHEMPATFWGVLGVIVAVFCLFYGEFYNYKLAQRSPKTANPAAGQIVPIFTDCMSSFFRSCRYSGSARATFYVTREEEATRSYWPIGLIVWKLTAPHDALPQKQIQKTE